MGQVERPAKDCAQRGGERGEVRYGELGALRVDGARQGGRERERGELAVEHPVEAASSSTPRPATASRPAARETALLTPEAMPACRRSTEPITAAVSGATVAPMPSPSTAMPGKKVLQ